MRANQNQGIRPMASLILSAQMNLLLRTATILSALLAASCRPQSTPDGSSISPVPELEITSFSLKEYPEADIVIDNNENAIYITLPYGTIPGNATMIFTASEGVSATPGSGSSIDLSRPFPIYLSLESGDARKYSVSASLAPASTVTLRRIVNVEYGLYGRIEDMTITFLFPFGADVTSLTFAPVTSEEGVSFTPDITSVPVDLTEPLSVTATSPDGNMSIEYLFVAEVSPQETAVRGVYLPDPAHTSSFITYDNVKASIDLLDDLNFNCLFVCAWARTKTAWDSEVLTENSTYGSARAGNLYAGYRGGSGDALKDIIDVAHSKDIKVILWFEYGFMHGIGGVNTADPLLAKHPEWIGLGNDGGYSCYNGSDYYLNSYDPEVQNFMILLMEEAVRKYPDVDGIQGDDRMPAAPRNSGYNGNTREAYHASRGVYPPDDINDSDWVRWRLDNLNAFARNMSSRLKTVKPSLIVCSAPQKYPWGEGVLMQEWPAWVKDDAVDLLTVQFYVTATYESDVKQALEYVGQNTDLPILNPAMILKNGDAVLSENILVNELQFNREAGTCGESQFWFDGLKVSYVQEVFRSLYPEKALWPEWLGCDSH